jgi:AmmeMemoRadiSam system protein A
MRHGPFSPFAPFTPSALGRRPEPPLGPRGGALPEHPLLRGDPLLRLAWQALWELVEGREPMLLFDALPQLSPPQACFVSLKLSGRLRGCIGTLTPTQPSLEAEIVANTVAASRRDPRFPPVERNELDRIAVSLDLLSPPEPVASAAELDPKRFGVIVRSGARVESAARQIAICRDKADIAPDATVTLERFTVVRIGG